jgi:hypothetical protein
MWRRRFGSFSLLLLSRRKRKRFYVLRLHLHGLNCITPDRHSTTGFRRRKSEILASSLFICIHVDLCYARTYILEIGIVSSHILVQFLFNPFFGFDATCPELPIVEDFFRLPFLRLRASAQILDFRQRFFLVYFRIVVTGIV